MQVYEAKESLASMSAAEVAEIEAFIQDLKSDHSAAPTKGISFEEAAEHVRTDYAHLLHKLSQ